MQVNWLLVTYFMVGFFAISGFSRGWWKEAMTTVFLAFLLFLLQNPDVAQVVVETANDLLATIWSLIPLSVQPTVTELLRNVFAIETGGGPIQLDPGASGTWVMILAIVLSISILFSRAWLRNTPTSQGSLLGALIGGFNGFFALNLFREYLDGRALPGSEVPQSEIALAGDSSFGTAASSLSIQAVNLPTFTILDTIIPWIIIIVSFLLLFAILRTRIEVLTNPQGMKKINFKRLPPFYAEPKVQTRRERFLVLPGDQ
ncbi:MAG: hypothetical protein R3264_05225 [Anaerolineae bacterium]|nr:hypothetical protein [Anaerolineae bacterium]